MGIIIAAAAVVGGIIYVLFVLLSYYSESARLAQEMEAVKVRTDGQRRRLGEYEERVASLQLEMPGSRASSDRLRLWIDLLKNQRATLEGEQRDPRMMSNRERRAAVAKGLIERRRGKQV
jgi:hypothetical protein